MFKTEVCVCGGVIYELHGLSYKSHLTHILIKTITFECDAAHCNVFMCNLGFMCSTHTHIFSFSSFHFSLVHPTGMILCVKYEVSTYSHICVQDYHIPADKRALTDADTVTPPPSTPIPLVSHQFGQHYGLARRSASPLCLPLISRPRRSGLPVGRGAAG